MKRKVVQHGTNTLTVSLPASWVKKNDVKAGDELEVEDKVTVLEVSKGIREDNKEITVTVKDISSLLFRRVVGNLYRLGYDTIDLRFVSEEEREQATPWVQDIVGYCIGFEIVSNEGKKILIKSFASVKQNEYENALRRYFLLTVQITETFLEAIEKKDSNKFEEVLSLERKQSGLFLYCSRVLYKSTLHSKEQVMAHYLMVARLEEIADEYRDMAKYLLGKKVQISTSFIELVKEANEYLRDVYRTYYSFSGKEVENIAKKKHYFDDKRVSLLTSKEDPVLLHHLFTIVMEVYDASSPVVALNIVGHER